MVAGVSSDKGARQGAGGERRAGAGRGSHPGTGCCHACRRRVRNDRLVRCPQVGPDVPLKERHSPWCFPCVRRLLKQSPLFASATKGWQCPRCGGHECPCPACTRRRKDKQQLASLRAAIDTPKLAEAAAPAAEVRTPDINLPSNTTSPGLSSPEPLPPSPPRKRSQLRSKASDSNKSSSESGRTGVLTRSQSRKLQPEKGLLHLQNGAGKEGAAESNSEPFPPEPVERSIYEEAKPPTRPPRSSLDSSAWEQWRLSPTPAKVRTLPNARIRAVSDTDTSTVQPTETTSPFKEVPANEPSASMPSPSDDINISDASIPSSTQNISNVSAAQSPSKRVKSIKDKPRPSTKRKRFQGVVDGPVGPRVLWTPPKSPFGLIQEQLYQDPWKVLVACMLLNKTSGKVVHQVIWNLFKIAPTPEATVKLPVETISEVIRPLGLYNIRAKSIKRMSEDYIKRDWTSVLQLHGVGKYASDAYNIFCEGRWREVDPDDHMLNKYHEWLKQTDGYGCGYQ
eukprot:jgi/Chlat1/834/Chrsp104S01175